MEVAGSADTSTGAPEVTTDAGPAYLKPLGDAVVLVSRSTFFADAHMPKCYNAAARLFQQASSCRLIMVWV
jgi:hypothetical protein